MYRRARPDVDPQRHVLGVSMGFVAVVVRVDVVRHGSPLVGGDLRPAPPLRWLPPERTTARETVVDPARIVFATGIERPQVGEVERHLVEEARPDFVAAVVPGVVGTGEQ